MNDIAFRLFGKERRSIVLRVCALHLEWGVTFDELLKETKLKKAQLTDEVAALKRAKVIALQKTKQGDKLIVVDPAVRELLPKLFLDSAQIADAKLISTIKKAGTLKLLICTGVLVGEQNTALDVLLVGTLNEKQLARALKPHEERHGSELRCAVFTEEEFHHRLDVRDRLITDVLQATHRVLLDKTKRPLR